MTSFPLRPRVGFAGALVAAGLLTGAVAAGAATADPPASGPPAAEPSAEHEQRADQRERKAERQERKAERKAEQQRRKDGRRPGPADRPGAPAVTGPAFVCDPALSHGQNVSAYARSLPKGPGRGRLVSQAARSDCGKPTTGD